jgi:hypothetical protein
MYKPHKYVTAIFTFAEGGVTIPRLYGFKRKPIHPVGWTYCKIRSFQPCKNPRKVLFAPIHVNGNGFLTPRETETNKETFRRLVALLPKIQLVVRYLHRLEWNGLWRVPGVKYIKGRPDQSTREIDQADVVVAHQNMGYLAVARGKPLLMMAENLVPISGSSERNVKTVASWDKYKHELMFPHDILAGDDTMKLIRAACRPDVKVEHWKKKFIGKPFDPEKFITILRRYL